MPILRRVAWAWLILALLLPACGRQAPSRPARTGTLPLLVGVTPPGPGAPEVNPATLIRAEVRDAAGELVGPPVSADIGPNDETFELALEAAPGDDRMVGLLAFGTRPVAGGAPDETAEGVLFLDRVAGVDIAAGQIETIELNLELFVPEFEPFTDTGPLAAPLGGSLHTIRWLAVPNAERYRLRLRDGNGGTRDTTFSGTSFTGIEVPMTYQVAAVDLSGEESAPSDYLHVSGTPILAGCVDPLMLDFGADLTSVKLSIANCGSGVLEWSVSTATPWLGLDPLAGSSTGETDEVTVTADRSGLAPGTYTGFVAVTTNGGNEDVPVTMEVRAVPLLCVEPLVLDFGTTRTVDQFVIANCGSGGSLEWTATETSLNASLNRTSGRTDDEPDTVTVSIDRTGLQPGQYQLLIAVESNAGNETVTVNLAVPAQPALCVDPLSLDFGAALTELTIDVTNCGSGGTLGWTALDDQDWITLDVVAGTTTLETDQVKVTVNRGALAPGDYTGSVTFTSDNSQEVVAVAMSVPSTPRLCVEPAALDFQFTTIELPLTIQNCGVGGAVNWTATTKQSWIALDGGPETSGATTTDFIISVTVDREGLDPGTLTGEIDVMSDAGSVTVPVSATVPAFPELCVEPDLIEFGEVQTSADIDVTNCGNGGVLVWMATVNRSWLSVGVPSGSTETETDVVPVFVDRKGLEPGTHEGQVTFGADAGSEDVLIRVEVPHVPALCVAPDSLNFGADLTEISVSVSNCGTGGELSWTTSSDQFWFETSAAGTTSTEVDVFTTTVDRSDLNPGFYNAILSVVSSAGTVQVPVSIEVAANPTLCVTPLSLDFGSVETLKTLDITNCGDSGVVDWQATSQEAWIDVTPGSGSTASGPDPVSVVVDRGMLAPGSHTGTVTVETTGTGPPMSFDVTVIAFVPGVPVLCVDTSSLSFGTLSTIKEFDLWNCGSGTLNWGAVADQPWMFATPPDGISTGEHDQITISVSRAGLNPGTYTGSIVLSSDGGNTKVSVTMDVPTVQSPPNPPTSVVATFTTGGFAIDVFWSDAASNETGYTVERRIGTGSWSVVGSLPANATAFRDVSISCNTYTYRVKACNGAGCSAAVLSNRVPVLCADNPAVPDSGSPPR